MYPAKGSGLSISVNRYGERCKGNSWGFAMRGRKYGVLAVVVAVMAMILGLFAHPALAWQAQIGADALQRHTTSTDQARVVFEAGDGAGMMADDAIVTAEYQLDAQTGQRTGLPTVPTTTLPKSHMRKDGATFIGWQPKGDNSIVLPDRAVLHGLTYETDTDGDGVPESFSLINSVDASDGALHLVAQYEDQGRLATQQGTRGALMTAAARRTDALSVHVQARKILNDRPLRQAEFAFVLQDGSGTIVRTASNSDDGLVRFGALFFTTSDVGEHCYTMREIEQRLGGVDLCFSAQTPVSVGGS